jgi:Flp pilus assembly protein TadD
MVLNSQAACKMPPVGVRARQWRMALAGVGLLALAACQTMPVSGVPVRADRLAMSPLPDVVQDVREADLIATAKAHYRAADFGASARYYERAVAAFPGQAEPLLGLAASYDGLGQFDLADATYAQLLRLTGPDFSYRNNRGFSYLLRGDHGRAQLEFEAALALSPGNETARNNLALLARLRASMQEARR